MYALSFERGCRAPFPGIDEFDGLADEEAEGEEEVVVGDFRAVAAVEEVEAADGGGGAVGVYWVCYHFGD